MKRAANRSLRLNILKDRLEGRPTSVVDLAREFGVGKRTIERDLEDLRSELRTAVVSEGGKHSIPPRPSALNDVEALAVYSAARLLQHTRIGEKNYKDAMHKLANMVGEPARSLLIAGVERQRSSKKDRTFDKVARAWFSGRVIKCSYRNANSIVKKRELKVYFIEIHRRNLATYVIAADRLGRDEPNTWKLNRMENVDLLEDRYEIPADLDIASLLKDSGGAIIGERVEVTVRVKREAALMFEEVDETILVSSERQEDGSLVAQVQGALSDQGQALELVPWLMGWGAAIEVLDPPAIREEIAAKLAAAAAQYKP